MWIELPSTTHHSFHFFSVAKIKEELAQVNPDASKYGSKQVLLDRLISKVQQKEERVRRLQRGKDAVQSGEVDPVFVQVF